MSGQNRLLVTLVGIVAVLLLVVGGLTVVATVAGGGDDDGGGGGGSGGGVSTEDSGDAIDGGDTSGQLRLAGSDPVTLDPALSTDAGSAQFIMEIFSGLVTIAPDLSIQLDLAESLDVSTDGTVYTFTLRDDAVFHNGRAVTADDIVWSINRAASQEVSSPVALAYLGDIVGVREYFFGQADSVSGIEVVDERTVRITIDAPKPYFLAKLTYPTAFVIDRQQVEANQDGWTRRPNGTGPYRLREWRLGERLVLEANQRFYQGVPPIETVVYELSGGSALTRFENGELDVAFISINDIERARDPNSDLGKLYQSSPEMSVSYLALNNNQPPFDDPNVRRALAMAIDRATVASVTFQNMVVPATGVMPPGTPGYTPEDKTLPFDPDEARRLLAESSYGGPENLPPIVITEVGGGAEARIDTQAFIEQWRQELGIEVQIRQTDFATFLADQDAGRTQAANAGWVLDYPDPESVLDLKFHSGSSLNDVGYSNEEVDALLDQARVEQDPDARLQLYRDAENLIIQDAAWIPLYFSVNHTVVSERVQDWFDPPLVMPQLRFISLSEE